MATRDLPITDAHYKAIRHMAAIKSWRTRRRNAGTKGSTGKSGFERTERMKTARAKSLKELGGGVSKTYVVELEGGGKAVFRSGGAWGSGWGATSDVAAFAVADLVGMGDIVPAAAIRTLKTPEGRLKGALCEWQEGVTAEQFMWGNVKGEAYGSSFHDVRRAAMFDWVIGNSDRHEGNWVVDGSQLRLIDHNIAFNRDSFSMILDSAKTQVISESEFQSYVKPYMDNLPKIKTRLADLGVPAIRIKWVEERIEKAAVAKHFDELRN
jgi:hypothetical protein